MSIPNLQTIDAAAKLLDGAVIQTPILPLASARWDGILPDCASVTVKLELFQQAGSFKARGVLLGVKALSDVQRRAGVVAARGGNHALAVSWAAGAAGVQAQITMPHHVDPERIAACRALGADVTLHDDMAAAFGEMERLADAGATMIHPFESPHMILGAATMGAEYLAQVPDLDVLVVPIGGGGMIAGMAAAAKLINPAIKVIGVEPVGGDSMTRSFAAGQPVTLDAVTTLADSLGAPKALPLSFGVARDNVDRIVMVPDSALLDAMEHMRRVLRIMAEPACAASLAALIGPLRDDIAGQNVGIIACGSNIGLPRCTDLLARRD